MMTPHCKTKAERAADLAATAAARALINALAGSHSQANAASTASSTSTPADKVGTFPVGCTTSIAASTATLTWTITTLSCFLPFTLYPFWTGVRVKGNPYPVITR